MKKHLLLASLLLPFFIFPTTAQEALSEEDLYNTSKVVEVKISFVYDNWAYLLDSLRFNGDGLLLGDVEINGEKFENAGIRYKASKAFQPGQRRNSLYIKLNYINKDQNTQGYKTLHLSNALRDPSLVREVLGFEIARKYMPAPKANYAQVFINGDPYGLMVNIEPIEEQFLQTHFGTSNGPLLKARSYDQEDNFPPSCKQNIYGSLEFDRDVECYLYNYEIFSEDGWDDLIELTRILEEDPDKIAAVLNIDNALWMLAFNNVVVNLNSYSGRHSQNYYLYKDDLGQFSPILWDMNLAFASYKSVSSGSDLTLEALQQLDPMLHSDNPTKPLISSLLSDEFYQKVYLSHMRRILYDFFKNDLYKERAKELQQQIQVLFLNDPNRHYSYDDFNNSLTDLIGKRSRIPGLVDFMDKRTDFLLKHPQLSVLPPEISGTQVIGRQRFSNKRIKTFRVTTQVERYPKKVRILYRFNEDDPFVEALMKDDGAQNDGAAGDGTFGITIQPEEGQNRLEYLIIAENASLVAFDPPNYMWERFVITLDEVNK